MNKLSLAPMAPVTFSLVRRPRNLITTVRALKARLTQGVTASQPSGSNRRLPKPSLLGFSAFDIRDSSFYL
jgi:hypothetical protein